MRSLVQIDYESGNIKALHEWIQKKLGLTQHYRFTKSKDLGVEINENKYSTKYVVKLLAEKYPSGKALFYFNGKNDYITLSSNGQLNVRGGEEDMFKAWGKSEFRKLNPQSIFQDTEKDFVKIIIIPTTSLGNYTFNSYNEFIRWLAC